MAKFPPPPFTGPELCQLAAHQVVDLLKQGEVKPSEVLDAALTRLQQVEPLINATPIACPERAHQSLAKLEKHAKTQRANAGWLAGLPITIKDLTDVAGVKTTYGTLGLKNNLARQSDPLVELMEQRGAVIVGKTNTPEFGAGGNTFNAVFGRTCNPWDVSKNAGGSSGGAAAALASGEVWLSHGSDLGGSLRTPAAYCGVVGLRPSPGRAGGAPVSVGFNTEGVSGPMARSVQDVALFLDTMAGYDPRSPLSLEAPQQSFQHAVLNTEPKDITIAFSPDLNGLGAVEPDIDHLLRNALQQVQGFGLDVELACPNLDDLEATFLTLRALTWLSLPARLPVAIQKHYKTTLREDIAAGRQLTIEQVTDAQVKRSTLYRTVQQFLTRFDVLACPVVGVESRPLEEEYPTEVAGQALDSYVSWLKFSYLATVTSLPALSLPVGFTRSGMPMGLQLIGRPRGESQLLAVAKRMEDIFNLPKTPIDPRQLH